MSKPRFTPDPPPEGADPRLVEWANRQFQRIEDWWPKSYDARLDLLEALQPYAPGVWPIVDSFSVSFFAESQEEQPSFVNTAFLYDQAGATYHATPDDYDSFGAGQLSSGDKPSNLTRFVDSGEGHAIGLGDTWYRTTDGETWDEISAIGLLGSNDGVVWFGDKYIAIGNYNSATAGFGVYSSTDGTSWTELFSDSGNDFRPTTTNAIATDGTTLLVTGTDLLDNRLIRTSTDGVNWTTTNLSATLSETIRRPFYVNVNWYISTFKGRLARASNPTGSYSIVFGVGSLNEEVLELVHGNGLYILRVDGVSSLYQSTTASLGSWSVLRTTGASNGGIALDYNDDYGWLHCYGTKVEQSSDGITWSDTNLSDPAPISSRAIIRMQVPGT